MPWVWIVKVWIRHFGAKNKDVIRHKSFPNRRIYKHIVHNNKLDYRSGCIQVHTYTSLLALKVCTSWLQKIHAILKNL